MSEQNNSWAESWAASQQALITAMSPIRPKTEAKDLAADDLLLEHFSELQRTWQDSIAKWADLAKEGAAVPTRPESLMELFAPARWGGSGDNWLDSALRHALEGPKYATLFDLDRKLLELQHLATQRDKDVAAFQTIVQEAWNESLKRFSSAVAKEDGKPTTWRAMADRWISVVNETLIEFQRSEQFVTAQSKMLRSASNYRLQERKIAEAWCEAFHVPTRTEMDEMQRTVTDLRRQLRSLQRTTSPTGQAASAPARPRRKRAAASRSSSLSKS